MSHNQIIYRPAVMSDIPQMVSLFNTQYARKKSKKYFVWQGFQSYYPTVYMTAFIGPTLIGVFGLQKRRLNNGVSIGHLIDLLIAPEQRGKGIFKELYYKAAAQFSDLQVFSVLPNMNGKSACEKSLGFQTLTKINDLVLSKMTKSTFSTISEASIDVEKNYISYAKDNEYSKWRYNKNPEYTYNQINLDKATFAITKLFVDPVTQDRFTDIVDYVSFQPSANQLFKKISTTLLKQKVPTISTWALPHTPYYSIAKSLGFIELSRERYFCIKILKSKLKYLYDIKNWHLVPADAEIY